MTSKVEGSTLIEVIIATVIIMGVFTIALAIFTKVTQSGYSFSRTTAQQQMRQMAGEAIRNKDYEEQRLETDSITYVKTVEPYAGYDDLLLLRVEALQEQNNLGTYRLIIKNEN